MKAARSRCARWLLATIWSASAMAVTACGGGGGGDNSPPPATVPAPTISAQPVSLSVAAGAAANFSVTAAGTTLTYAWQTSTDGGATWSAISGATAASYTISATDASMNASQYRVIVTSAGGSATSNAAILTVTSTTAAAPTIATQPVNQNLVAGGSATFTVVAAGASLTYQWQSSPDGTTWTAVASATQASLTLSNVTTAQSGIQYRVIVTNAGGSITSAAATLVVTAATAGSAPAITTQPADVSVLAPDTATFTAAANGSPAPSFQWQSSSDAGSTFANISGATAASYAISATVLANNLSQFRVVVTNSAGSATSHSAKLTVYNPGFGGLGQAAAVDSTGNIYVTVVPDTVGYIENVKSETFYGVRKIDTNGVVTTLAGSHTSALVDGTGTAASFVFPYGIAVDSAGNVFVADEGANAIRKISPAGVVTTYAGGDLAGGFVNGTGAQASFHQPIGVAVDASGIVYVADRFNNAIRKIAPGGVVTTLAGGGSPATFDADGVGAAAGFYEPQGVAVDAGGTVYVADTGACTIRKISVAASVTTIAGSASSCTSFNYQDGIGTAATFSFPGGIAVDSSGVLFVADTNDHAVRKILASGTVSTIAGGHSTDAIVPNSMALDASGTLYFPALYVFPYAPYEIEKIDSAAAVTSTPPCCSPTP